MVTLTDMNKEEENTSVSPVRILLTHPSTLSYHENSRWIPISGLQDKHTGIWLMPGQSLAVINTPIG